MKTKKWWLAAALALCMTLCACGETLFPTTAVGDLRTARSKAEVYEQFRAGNKTQEKGDKEATAFLGTKEQGVGLPVKGYEQPDLVKTRDNYLYILDAGDLKIVSAEGTQVQHLSTTSVRTEGDEDAYETGRGLFIQGNTAAVIVDAEVFDGDDSSYYTDRCSLRLFDISDPTAPKLYAEFAQDGYLMDARLHDGILYLASIDYKFSPKRDEDETFLPCIWNEGKSQTLSPERIYLRPQGEAVAYTVVSAIDLKNSRRTDTCAFTGSGSGFYMDKTGLYLTRTLPDASTELKRLSASEGTLSLSHVASVPGQLLNLCAIDVQNDTVRLITAVPEGKGQKAKEVCVFTLDEELRQTGSVTGLAAGQRLYSARLMGDAAYVATYSPSQPWLTIDLSDPKAPTLRPNDGDKPMSNYLHAYRDDLLFGLGLNEEFRLQAELLNLDGTPVASMPLHYEASDALQNPQTVLLSAEKALAAFPAEGDYIVLQCKEEELVQLATIPFDYQSDGTRALVLGDTLYLCDAQAVTAVALDDLAEPVTITFGAG